MKYLTTAQKKQLQDKIRQKQQDAESLTKGISLSLAGPIAKQTQEYVDLTNAVNDAIQAAYDIIEKYRPKDGYSPIIGKDFYTDAEKKAFIKYIFDSLVTKLPSAEEVARQLDIRQPEDGHTPTPEELELIVLKCMPKMDYLEIAQKIKSLLPENGLTEEKDIIAELKQPGGYHDQVMTTVKTMFNRMQAANSKWRGGGDTVKAGTNITITVDADGNKVISSTGGGAASTPTAPTSGAINGVNTTFVFASKPIVVISDSATYEESHGWSWNAGTNTVTMDVPPTYDIFSYSPALATSGTVTAVSVVTANGFSGSVANPGTTPAITLNPITKRIVSITSSATPTPNIDTTDDYHITALATGATFGAPTGTPTDGQNMIMRIKDNGSAQTLSFNAIYRFSSDLPAPTTTIISKTFYLGFKYNATDTKWDNLAQLNNL